MPASANISTELTHPQQQNLTGDAMKLAIEKFQAKVQKQYMAEVMLDSYFEVINLTGTNFASKDGLGSTVIAPLVAGISPTGTKIERGRGKVYVKVPMIARATFGTLEDVQDNIGVRGKTSALQGEVLAEFFDRTGFEMAVRAALITDTAKLKVSTYQLGTKVEMAAVGDELDTTKLESKVNEMVVTVEGKVKKRPDYMTIFMKNTVFNTMARNKDLVDRDYNQGNGDFARRTFHATSGVPCKSTFLLPGAAQLNASHPLTCPEQDYSVTEPMTRTLALIMEPEAVIVGRSIPLTSKVWWNEDNKCWYVDSWYAFGMAPDRLECAGVLLSKGA